MVGVPDDIKINPAGRMSQAKLRAGKTLGIEVFINGVFRTWGIILKIRNFRGFNPVYKTTALCTPVA